MDRIKDTREDWNMKTVTRKYLYYHVLQLQVTLINKWYVCFFSSWAKA